MKKSLSKKATIYSIILGLLTLAATALPFQYIPNNSVTLFTAIFGTRSLQPLTFTNTIATHLTNGGAGFIAVQILSWSIVAFLFSALINAVINLILLNNPHNLFLIAFRNYYTYFHIAISTITATVITVWTLATLMIYGAETFINFGIALSVFSLLAIAQVSVASTCLKNSNVKIEITAYNKEVVTNI